MNDSAPLRLRVAIIGAGPAGFYTAEQLLRSEDPQFEVDLFDQLPTPYGLVRAGVAPDHAKIKNVTRKYDATARHESFRFYGNVTLNSDVSVTDLRMFYHQIVYCTGAQEDRLIGIPGEDLRHSHSATEFVAWYNGHPDFRDREFDLSKPVAVVVGVGNVAVDVARILCRTCEELKTTDIADYALAQLAESAVEDVYMLGRRGPAQAAFTNPEAKELGELPDADILVSSRDAALDPVSRQWLADNPDRLTERKVELIEEFAGMSSRTKRKRLHLRFLVSPVEILGSEEVTGIRIVRNEINLVGERLRPSPTSETEVIDCGLVFRSVGYRGRAIEDVPFDDKRAIVRNEGGRVVDDDGFRPGEYVAGWIKRGPTGVIGTNKADAQETVALMIEDAKSRRTNLPTQPGPAAADSFIRSRSPDLFSWADWQRLDHIETERGKPCGRPRIKCTTRDEMIAAIRK